MSVLDRLRAAWIQQSTSSLIDLPHLSGVDANTSWDLVSRAQLTEIG